MSDGAGELPPAAPRSRSRWWRIARWLAAPVVLGLLPALAYAFLISEIERYGGAGVMLGAVAGASLDMLAGVALTLALRIYLVVLLPGLLVYALVFRLLSRPFPFPFSFPFRPRRRPPPPR